MNKISRKLSGSFPMCTNLSQRNHITTAHNTINGSKITTQLIYFLNQNQNQTQNQTASKLKNSVEIANLIIPSKSYEKFILRSAKMRPGPNSESTTSGVLTKSHSNSSIYETTEGSTAACYKDINSDSTSTIDDAISCESSSEDYESSYSSLTNITPISLNLDGGKKLHRFKKDIFKESRKGYLESTHMDAMPFENDDTDNDHIMPNERYSKKYNDHDSLSPLSDITSNSTHENNYVQVNYKTGKYTERYEQSCGSRQLKSSRSQDNIKINCIALKTPYIQQFQKTDADRILNSKSPNLHNLSPINRCNIVLTNKTNSNNNKENLFAGTDAELLQFSDGKTEEVSPNGTRKIKYKNGTVKFIYPSSSNASSNLTSSAHSSHKYSSPSSAISTPSASLMMPSPPSFFSSKFDNKDDCVRSTIQFENGDLVDLYESGTEIYFLRQQDLIIEKHVDNKEVYRYLDSDIIEIKYPDGYTEVIHNNDLREVQLVYENK